MFGRLNCTDDINPGDVLNLTVSFDLIVNSETQALALKSITPRHHTHSKNLLLQQNQLVFRELILIGIQDGMKFVTPAEYKKEEMYHIVDKVLDIMS